jgi:pimeloyl-ACP methyl ester carboxylesterase
MATLLSALGEERLVVLGLTPPPAMLFAATHPARTKALMLLEPSARFRADDGYTGLEDVQVELALARLEREWGTGVGSRLFGWAGDERLQRWYGKCERLMHTPLEAAGVNRSVYDTELRDVVPTISVPTLVVVRGRSPMRGHSR